MNTLSWLRWLRSQDPMVRITLDATMFFVCLFVCICMVYVIGALLGG
jgi:hypothetical protein